MRIAAILTLTKAREVDEAFPLRAKKESTSSPRLLGDSSCTLVDILGESVLNRAIAKLKSVGTLTPCVIAPDGFRQGTAPGAALVSNWENAVAGYINNGVDALLLMRVNAYADLDYGELLQQHLQTRSPLTQVDAVDGPLDVALVDASLLRHQDGGYRKALRTLIPRQRQFAYDGYVNRLRGPQDYYELAMDGLLGNCDLRPRGREVREGTWVGGNTSVDPSSSISTPAFLGANVRIEAACRITGPSSIERNCTIDCGTTVRDSCVLPHTYVGVALEVRRAVVNSGKLFHLDHNVEVNIADSRLVRANSRSFGFISGLGSLLRGSASAAD